MPRLPCLVAWCLLLGNVALTHAAAPQLPGVPTDHIAGCALTNSRVSLQPTPVPRFVLRYQGPVILWNGPLCYRFEGYNRTCKALGDGWLTAATVLEFAAPGQVPLDLLQGYRLILSAPQMFDGVLHFAEPLADATGWLARPPASWNCATS
ncbi:MAG: hypothetical protein AB8B93_01255 [Pseudomonadales bacterium]